MQIFYSPEFFHRYKNLSIEIKEKIEKREEIFRKDPFDRRLKTHKLHGRFHEFWAFSVDFDCRIVSKLHGKNIVMFYSIGGHAIYK